MAPTLFPLPFLCFFAFYVPSPLLFTCSCLPLPISSRRFSSHSINSMSLSWPTCLLLSSSCLPPLLVSSLSPVLSLLISLHLCSSPHPSPFRVLAFGPLIELASLEFATKAGAAENPVFVFRALLSEREWAGLLVCGRISEGGIFTATLWSCVTCAAFLIRVIFFCRMLFIAAVSLGA